MDIARRPPPYIPTTHFGRTFRFVALGNIAGVSVTRKNLLNLLQIGTSTSTSARAINAIKLNRIRIWGPTTSGFASQTVTVQWEGLNAPTTEHSDTSMNLEPAYVTSKPPMQSSCSWWSIYNNNESEVLFTLTIPAASVVDIEVSVRLIENSTTQVGEVPSGGVIGEWYYNYLDGSASGLLNPVGAVTIFP